MTATASQLRKELAALRKLAELQTPGMDPVIIVDPEKGTPDLSGLDLGPGEIVVILPDNGRDPDPVLWSGPYLSDSVKVTA